MKAISDMLHAEVMAELETLNEDFGPGDYARLESELNLRAAALHWTGDPLRQPPRVVLAAARVVVAQRGQPVVLQSSLP